ncbi:MAG: hypothetical protein ACI4D7_10785, partial [Lachnospiraceae bacterium]
MSNEENIPVLTKTDLITLLQNMDDHVILTINLEGDAKMAKHNPFELERVSVRLVRDSGGPLISDVPLNSPKMVAKLLYNEIFADLDREIFAVVNL